MAVKGKNREEIAKELKNIPLTTVQIAVLTQTDNIRCDVNALKKRVERLLKS